MRGFPARADQQHGPEVVTARPHETRRQAQRDLLGRQKEKVDDTEDHQKEAADELQSQAVGGEREERRSPEGDFHRAPDLFAERQRAMAAVEAGRREQQAPDRKDQKEQEPVLSDRVQR